jgi:LysM repeat protein
MASYKKDNLTEAPLIWVDQSFLRNLQLGNEIGGVTVDPKPDPKPTPKPKQYTIVAGDSLSSIATKFNTTVSKIMTLNGIVNADRIRIGQVLKLP